MTVAERMRKQHIIDSSPSQLRVAYIVSRFPKLTETFILYEILAVQEQGVQVELYPLQREHTTLMHPEAKQLMTTAHFQPPVSWPIIRANLHFLRRKPRTYVKALRDLLRATWGSLRYFAGALIFFLKTVRFAYLMEAAEITHIHAHFASHPAAAAFVIHRLTGIPYSFTAHGSDLHRDRHMLREKTAEAEFVVTISHYNKQIFIDECGEQVRHKVAVIRSGVDTQAFQPRSNYRQDGPPHHPLTIVCIGTLHEVKGQTHLIEACRLLRDKGIDFTCHFVGDGPDRDALSAQVAAAGLGDHTRFDGQKTRQEVIALLRKADILAAPSVPSRDNRREGIPVVLMEAMVSGVAVVASDLSGIPELVENEVSGLLVPPGNPAALAGALEHLYRDPALRQRLGQGGRGKVLREFDLEASAAALVRGFSMRGRV
jgi:colanic acid/amylovoran biosynthesis glycosyltransferase